MIESEGIRLNLLSAPQEYGAPDLRDGRRAAWYSLAFLLRKVAAARLDIEPLELAAGIFAGVAEDGFATYAFIADTLENGAGFSTHLGSKDELPRLIEDVRVYLGRLAETDHAAGCSSSCYRCLRDYGNMSYHALLDWRLAGDLLDVLRHGRLTVDQELQARTLHAWSRAYDGATLIDGVPGAVRYGEHILIVRHPLEASEKYLMGDRLAEMMAEAEARSSGFATVVFADSFVLDRDPARVFKLFAESERRADDD